MVKLKQTIPIFSVLKKDNLIFVSCEKTFLSLGKNIVVSWELYNWTLLGSYIWHTKKCISS